MEEHSFDGILEVLVRSSQHIFSPLYSAWFRLVRVFSLERLATLACILALATLYFLAGKLGLKFNRVNGFASLIWAPSGIALAALAMHGIRLWPGIFLGALAVNLYYGAPLISALCMGGGNTLEAVIGVFFWRSLCHGRPSLERMRDVIGLVFGSAIFATAVSASIGPIGMILGNVLTWPQWHHTFKIWWMGDILGVLVVAPMLLLAADSRHFNQLPSARQLLEGLALFLLVMAACLSIFFELFSLGLGTYSVLYLIFPLVIWGALRFGPSGVIGTSLLVTLLGNMATLRGLGPFTEASTEQGLMHLQNFLAVFSASGLLLAAALAEQKALQGEKERLYRQAQNAIAVRDDILATVSHDLKNPLSSIKMNAAMILRSIESEQDFQSQQRKILSIKNSAERMQYLIEGLLDAAKLDFERVHLQKKSACIKNLVNSAFDLMECQASAKQIKLLCTFPAALPQVFCDQEKIIQVLCNLLSNAVKFSPRASEIKVDFAECEDQLQVVVKDQGPGIDADSLPKLFERYWQANSMKGQGHGLGLFIAKKIIEAHHGKIWAQNGALGGSNFFFTLPLA